MTLNLNQSPFFDDYDETKKYYEILFRPSIAVQARELTQLQTILQNQISRFGYHVFKEGSMVIPGEVGVDLNYNYVTIQDEYNLAEVDVSNLAGSIITGLQSGAIAEIVATEDSTSTEPKTLFVKYMSGNSSAISQSVVSDGTNILSVTDAATKFTVGMIINGGSGTSFSTGDVVVTEVNSVNDTVKVSSAPDSSGTLSVTTKSAASFIEEETLVIVESSGITEFATTSASDCSGSGAAVSIQQGVYFVNGRFCLVTPHTKIISKYSNAPSCRVGLVVTETIVDELEDRSLLDNANGSENYNAPGAHRLFVSLDLDYVESGTPNPNNFIELVHLESGVIQSKIERAQYAELEKAMARRTYDANGDFTTTAFKADIREHLNDGTNRGIYDAPIGDEAKLAIGLEPGKAYVKGFEVQTVATSFVDVDKGRETDIVQSAFSNIIVGSWVSVNNFNGTFDISNFETVNLMSAPSGAGTVVGTAKARNFERITASTGKLWLFDISMLSGYDYTFVDDVLSVVSSSNPLVKADILQTSGKSILNNTANNIALFKLPNNVIKTLEFSGADAPIYTVRQSVSGVSTAGGLFEIPLGSNVAFSSVSTNNYYITKNSDGTQPAGWSVSLNPELTTATFAGLGSGVAVTAIITYSKRMNNAAKTKTLTIGADVLAASSRVVLSKADVFSITTITSSVDGDVADRYSLDTGMRDNYYDFGAIVIKSGESVPGGNLTITYTYFEHGAGDYFSVDSYTDIDYADIPTYKSSSGIVFNLSDCVDFRPRIDESDGFGFSPLTKMAIDGTPFICDEEYYLPRRDKIFVTSNGEFVVKKGIASTNPQEPANIDDAMLLYNLFIPAYTFSTSDVQSVMQDNRGYTMRDIGKLEKRIENLEYYTSMNMLEQDTLNRFVDDGTGADAFKNGFVVDNFTSFLVGDIENSEFHCSMDNSKGTMRPEISQDSVAFSVDEGSLSGVVVNTNTITLPYTTESLVSQLMKSTTLSVNPYGAFFWHGSMKLDPSEDAYYDTGSSVDVSSENPNYYVGIQYGNRFSTMAYSGWVSNFLGAHLAYHSNAQLGSINVSFYDSNMEKVPGWVDNWGNLFSTDTGALLATGQFKQNIFINPLWSKEVGGQKQLDTSVVYYIRSQDVSFEVVGMRPNTRVYPFFDGISVSTDCTPATLTTDAAGSVSGTFTIPATATKKFRAGARQFKLTDSQTNDDAIATTTAFAMFVAGNNQINSDPSITSTAHVEPAKENIVSRERITSIRNYFDPIAQSFMVSNIEGGCFIKNLKLYFASKDSGNAPVRVEIRNMVNGYPGSVVVPYSSVTLFPDEVDTSVDGTVATTFTFSDPVYLQNNVEYCFIVWSASSEYTVWAAQLGDNEYGTNRIISKQPYSGVLFKSQNASTWVADPEMDMTFEMERCVFTTASDGSVSLLTAAPTSDINIDTFYAHLNVLNFQQTELDWACKRTAVGGTIETSFVPTTINTNVDNPSEYHINVAGDFVLQSTMSSSVDNLSPVVDMTAASLIAIENIINNDSTDETEATGGSAIAKYLTKPVVLDSSSNSVRIIFDAFMPSGSDILVFYKTIPDDSSASLDAIEWTNISSSELNGVLNSDTAFNEHEYTTGEIAPFSTFVVKIVMLSSSSARIPIVTNFRAIALDI